MRFKLNIIHLKMSKFFFRRKHGITAMRVHPDGSMFAVAERGRRSPGILVFSWPEKQILTEIR